MTQDPNPTIMVRRARDIPRLTEDWYVVRPHFAFHGVKAPGLERFGALTLVNDDVIAPGHGVHQHPHKNLDIVTYVVEGDFGHRDTIGNDFVLQRGEAEAFSFGTGAEHVERNTSKRSPLRMILLYIAPAQPGGEPVVHRRSMQELESGWHAIAGNGAMPLRQDASVYAGIGRIEQRLALQPQYGAYVYVIRGLVSVNSVDLEDGDAAAVTNAPELLVSGDASAHSLVIVVPMSTPATVEQADVTAIVGSCSKPPAGR